MASNAVPGMPGNNPEAIKARQDLFLEAFEELGTITHACKKTGIGRSTYKRWKRDDKFDFITRFNDVKDDFAEEIEQTLFQRAKDPKSNPVLLIIALKGLLPDKYKDNAQINDDTAKDIMKELKTKFRGIKFDEGQSAEIKTAQQQAEDILRGKSGKSE